MEQWTFKGKGKSPIKGGGGGGGGGLSQTKNSKSLTTMIPRPETSLSVFTSNPMGYLAHECNDLLQKTIAWDNGLTDLAHSGQFQGRTWLPYARITQHTDSYSKFVCSMQFNNHTIKFKNHTSVQWQQISIVRTTIGEVFLFHWGGAGKRRGEGRGLYEGKVHI